MELNLCYRTCSLEIIEYWRSVSPGKTQSEARFLTELFFKEDIPIHHDVFKNNFPAVYKEKRHLKMVEEGILTVTEYDKDKGLCRNYSIATNLKQQALAHFTENNVSLKYEYSDFIPHISSSKKVNQARDKLMKNDILLYVTTLKSLVKEAEDSGRILEPRIRSDTNNIIKMLSRAKPYNNNDKIIQIDRQLLPGSTGRLYEMNGGLQGISRKSKKINYSQGNYYNYDIRSCAVAAMSQVCKDIGIDTYWINDYISNPKAKYEYAQEIGISVAAWKLCLLSAVFGGNIDGSGTIADNIKDEVGSQRLDEVYAKFRLVAKPLLDTIEEWLESVQSFALKNSTAGTIVNEVGCRIDLYEKGKLLNRKRLSAFYLQGLEASFIYDLIISSSNSFKIVSYEFDGLVTEGEITPDLIEACKKSSGFTNAILEIKDF